MVDYQKPEEQNSPAVVPPETSYPTYTPPNPAGLGQPVIPTPLNKRGSRHHFIFLWALVWLVIVIALLVGSGYTPHHRQTVKHQSKSSGASGVPTNPRGAPSTTDFTVSGNKIVDLKGQQYIPSAITLFGLAGSTDWAPTVQSDESKIDAMTSFWHVNSVRFQVQADPVNNNTPNYLGTLDNEVNYALQKGLNVILSAQYEYTTKQRFPTSDTDTFWKTIAAKYGQNNKVWFDLFNEPNLGVNDVGGSETQLWDIWKNGGTVPLGTYVGMQTMVNDIRATGAQNLILAEGIDGAKSLDMISNYQLSGTNIVYAIHTYLKPNFDTPALWDTDWGNISKTLPVFDDEFGEHQGPQGSCRPDAPALVSTLFSYLSAHHIGLGGWTLSNGSMVRSSTDFTLPTKFDPGVPYTCPDHYVTGSSAQGAGQAMLDFWRNPLNNTPK